jgi:DNA gyrase subunit A
VLPDYPQNRDEFEVVTLKDQDWVVGAVQLVSEDQDLVFIASDAQLLRFPASAVRPQGRSAGGMAGIRLATGANVVWFGAVDPAAPSGAVVVTVAGSQSALPGTAAGSIKVSEYSEFPAKGRATGGVRCQRFVKGEDALVLAWAGAAPALGATEAGVPVDLPTELGRRDGSGMPLLQPLATLGGRPAS